ARGRNKAEQASNRKTASPPRDYHLRILDWLLRGLCACSARKKHSPAEDHPRASHLSPPFGVEFCHCIISPKLRSCQIVQLHPSLSAQGVPTRLTFSVEFPS